jgi:hypothetical protein
VAWLQVTPAAASIEKEGRLWVSVDWPEVPQGTQQVALTISGPGGASEVPVNQPAPPDQLSGLVESHGYVAMEAEQYTGAVEVDPIRWQRIPDLGRTLSGMTPFPVTAPSQTPGGDSPHLEYGMYLGSSGSVTVSAYLAPTLNFHVVGLRYAVSFDDAAPRIVNIHSDTSNATWQGRVSDNINLSSTTHTLNEPGYHVLKYWMVDPGVVLEKLVVSTKGTIRPSYLGPPTDRFSEPPVLGGVAGSQATAGSAGTAGDLPTSAGGSGVSTPGLRAYGGGCACRASDRFSTRGCWLLVLAPLAVARRVRVRTRRSGRREIGPGARAAGVGEGPRGPGLNHPTTPRRTG